MPNKNNPYLFGRPLNNPAERIALRNTFDTQAPWYEQIGRAMSNPFGYALGGVFADRAFDAMDQNEKVLAELKAAGIPVTTDRYGNYIPAGGSSGLLASLGRSFGLGGGSGLLGSLGSSGGFGAPSAYYGGYVRDASGSPIRGGDGFVTYGAGPQSVGNEAFAGEVGYDQ